MAEMSKFMYAYRTNPRFYLYYTYRDMRDRVRGKGSRTGRDDHPWLGLPLCDRTTFLDWAVNEPSFIREWNAWQARDWKGRGPTVHRVDRKGGYVIDNMIFVAHAEKSRMHMHDAVQKRKKTKVSNEM